MYRVRLSRALQRLLFLFILIAQSRAGLAQTISNPSWVDFDPSPDHFTLAADGTPVVSEYKMSVYVAGQTTAVKTVSLGKPDLQADDKIRLDFMALMSGFASPGVVYEAKVAASGPGGVVSSSSSNQFVYTPCATSLSAPAMTVDANGGNMTVSVATDAGCRWTASSSVIWAGFTTPWNNYGPGTIGLTIAPNNTQNGRTTTMTIAGQPFKVTQSGATCDYLVSGQGFGSPAAGTSAALSVTSPVGCAWTAKSNDAWVIVTAGASGAGDGSVTIATALNPTNLPRTGTATVAGKTVTITQEPLVCNYAIAVGSLPVPIGMGIAGAQTYTWSGSTTDVRGLLHGTSGRVMSAWYTGGTMTIEVAVPAGQAQQVALYLADFDGSGRSEKLDVLDTNGVALDSRTVADFSGGRYLVWTVQGRVQIQVTRLSGPNAVVSGVLLSPATFNPSRSGGAATFVKQDDATQGSWVGVYGATGHTFAADEDVQGLSSTGGAGTLMVTAPTGCPWTTTSDAAWLTLTSNASGSGSSPVALTAAANTGAVRTATVTVGDKTLTLTQLAGTPSCPLTLTPSGLNPTAAGGTGSVAVATASCNWTASSDAAWLTVTSGGSGTGAGTVMFAVAPNTTQAPRTATLTVGGQNLVVSQPGINCGFTLGSMSRQLGSAASSGSVALTAAAGCTWTASSSAAWLTVTSPASGSGSATLTFAVSANTGSVARTATLTIGGQTFTVTQDVGPCNLTIGTPNLPVPARITIGGAMTYVWADTTGDTRALQRALTDRVMAAWYGGTLTIDVQIPVGQAQQVAVYAADYDPWGRQQTFEVRDENGALLDSRSIADFAGGQYVVWTMRGHATIRVTATAGPNAVVSGVFLAPASAASLGSGSATAAAFTAIDTTTQGGWKDKYGSNGYTLAADETTNWVSASGGPGTVSVTAPSTCPWTATSDAAWVTFTTASGSGAGTAAFDVAPASSTTARTATLTVAGQTFTLTQAAMSAAQCTFTLSATAQAAPAAGVSGTVTVTSSGGCAWTAVSNAAWLTITSGASGSGTGAVGITAAPNTTGAARVGTLTIAGQTVTVTQAAPPCAYVLSTTAQSFPAPAGSGAVTVTAGTGCAWTATSSAAWLTVTAGATGTGTAAVSYSVAANTTPTSRTATLTVGGQTVTVTQAGVPCTYTLSATVQNLAAAAASGSVAVTAPAGCAWTAASSASWLTVTAGASGSGNGTVAYSAAANTSTSARTATLTIAGQTVTVDQAGVPCTYTISTTTQSFTAVAGTGSVAVTAPAGCAWTAASGASWLTVTAGASGSGTGSVAYSAAANTATAARTATLTIAGQTVTVTQAGVACTFTISATGQTVATVGGNGTVTVTAPSGCAWTSSSNASWATITSGGSGNGTGTLAFSVMANTGTTTRTAVLTIAGQTFTVTQPSAACNFTLSVTTRSLVAAAGTGTVTVTAPAGCTWTSSSSASWLTVTAGGSGNGTGTLTFAATANTLTSPRTATLTVAGQVVTVTQAGVTCTVTISATTQSVGSAAVTGSVTVTTPAGCTWTTTTGASWLTPTSGASGSGPGAVAFSVAANTATSPRTAALTIGGQTFTVTQDGASCVVTVNPGTLSFNSRKVTGTLTVSNASNCAWTATSSASWLTVTNAQVSQGTVSYSISNNNTGGTRTGTITIGTATVSVTQSNTSTPATVTGLRVIAEGQ